MPRIVVTLGVQFSELPHLPISVEVDVPTLEIDPDDVFDAANQIEDLEQDIDALPQAWQKELRLLVHLLPAPSMSTLDTIAMFSDSGELLGTWVCEMLGWSKLLPERTRA